MKATAQTDLASGSPPPALRAPWLSITQTETSSGTTASEQWPSRGTYRSHDEAREFDTSLRAECAPPRHAGRGPAGLGSRCAAPADGDGRRPSGRWTRASTFRYRGCAAGHHGPVTVILVHDVRGTGAVWQPLRESIELSGEVRRLLGAPVSA
jgi:hypothetical protein